MQNISKSNNYFEIPNYKNILGKIILLGIVLLSFQSISFPQTYEEIIRLQQEYEKLQEQQVKDADDIVKSPDTDLPTKIIYKPGDIESFYKEQLGRLVTNIRDIEEISEYLDSTQTLKHFGYDFFIKRDTSQFWQNLPMPSDYLLGSGDELIISVVPKNI